MSQKGFRPNRQSMLTRWLMFVWCRSKLDFPHLRSVFNVYGLLWLVLCPPPKSRLPLAAFGFHSYILSHRFAGATERTQALQLAEVIRFTMTAAPHVQNDACLFSISVPSQRQCSWTNPPDPRVPHPPIDSQKRAAKNPRINILRCS